MHKLSSRNLTVYGSLRIKSRNIITLTPDYPSARRITGADSSTATIRIFGTNGVKAALVARKRTFKYLYVYGHDLAKHNILRLARQASVEIVTVDNKGVLNNMADNRPHNGVVLECTELSYTKVSALGARSDQWLPILNNDDIMSTDQRVAKTHQTGISPPIYLLLDEITDPQNVGSIIRTAYFLGVSGLIMSVKNCASITPVVIKAASGATEFLSLFYTDSTTSFIRSSRKNGWICCATVGTKDACNDHRTVDFKELRDLSKLRPILLVFGSEGSGLRTLVKSECSKLLTVPARGDLNPTIDSLNVGVAVGVILGSLVEQ
ncbi:protein of unknown function [Taphrina deformans PYCC 5710]|uniref:rRNA methyltransferase 1, mitochondrial n=1 Tax=Taphrina deformans (strain PYCC 5710 / ATCC 11124 / CBS 356.35 / IMI 108563 / JCM 9778 / NBRC 8474) TaxID=1097556 RepID=R4XM46_TAPDE|nr:protein of unknown function [Taphrina deformans PYCC 5710]|eukprot:CCG84370.1 protein of unknown function [Taphrina deformans PYCC 5710]